MRSKLSIVGRVVLAVAVPAIALGLLWPVSWEASIVQVRGDKIERFTGTVFLRDDAGVQLACIVATLVWVYVLCLRRGLWASDGSLSNKPMQPASAPSGARG